MFPGFELLSHLTQYREIYLAMTGDMNVALQARLRKVIYYNKVRVNQRKGCLFFIHKKAA